MSVRRFCDRCGAELGHGGAFPIDAWGELGERVTSFAGMPSAVVSPLPHREEYGGHWDFCARCYSELRDSIGGKDA